MPEGSEFLAWLNIALSQWGMLLLSLLALVFLLLSRWRLALCSLFLAIGSYCLVMTGHRMVPDEHLRSAISVISASVYARNPAPEKFYDAILALKPDVVFWQEVPDVKDMLHNKQGAYFVAGQKQQGTLIFSRWPIQSQWYSGNILLARASLPDGKYVLLVNFHAPKFFIDLAGYNKFYSALIDELRQFKVGAVIVGGDFNATEFNYWRRLVRAYGFRSALQDDGSGWLGTFPASGRTSLPGIPLISIDDIYTRGVVPLRGEVIYDSAGSDHYPVRLFLNWLPEGA